MDEAFAAFTAFLVASLPLAVGVTKIVDTVRNLFDKAGTAPKWVWNIVALGIGVAFCVGWGFNLFEALIDSVPALKDSSLADGVPGQVATGLSVGAMAGFWHEKMDEWSSRAKANKAAVPEGYAQ